MVPSIWQGKPLITKHLLFFFFFFFFQSLSPSLSSPQSFPSPTALVLSAPPVLGVPRTTPGCDDLLEGLTEKLVSSPLWFIAVKGYKLLSAKEKGTWGRVQEKPGGSFQLRSLSGVAWTVLNSPSTCFSSYCPVNDPPVLGMILLPKMSLTFLKRTDLWLRYLC